MLQLRTGSLLLRLIIGGFDDGSKRLDLQACAADQGTIDIRLLHVLDDVVGFDATAVLDTNGFGNIVPVQVTERSTDNAPDNVVRDFAAGAAPGANRPDRLVGDDEGSCPRQRHPLARRELDRLRKCLDLAGLVFFQAFPDSDNRL